MKMKWSAFDIVGPVMIGPSSSHTSGAVKLGLFANKLIGGIPEEATIYLHGSYGEVYKGHGTDLALVAGLLGFEPDDENVVNSFEFAREQGMEFDFIIEDLGSSYHPNTAKFVLKKDTTEISLIGESIGAGKIRIVEINGIDTGDISGELDTLIVLQHDRPGVVADISSIIAKSYLNIATMIISREERGKEAMTVISLDDKISKEVLEGISKLDSVIWVKLLPII